MVDGFSWMNGKGTDDVLSASDFETGVGSLKLLYGLYAFEWV